MLYTFQLFPFYENLNKTEYYKDYTLKHMVKINITSNY